MKCNQLIRSRANAGIGNVSQIMSILKDVSLGYHYFRIAKILREAMLINGMLFSASAWYPISEQNLRTLEQVDESLLRQILGAHSKTPIEALYLELGCQPLRFNLMSRRVNYLNYILNLKEDDLLYKVFDAQVKNPVKGDWVLQVLDDLKILNITSNFNDIKKIKKNSFKNIVKDKVKTAAMTYLNKFKVKHSKMDNLTYKKLAIQPYLTSTKIYPQLAKDVFKWRTRMAKFKVNFRNGSDNIQCPLGCQHEDSQQNILMCQAIICEAPELKTLKVSYNDIFSYNPLKIKAIMNTLIKAYKIREDMMETITGVKNPQQK